MSATGHVAHAPGICALSISSVTLKKLKRPQADWYGAVNSKWSLCILGSGLRAENYRQQIENLQKNLEMTSI